MLDPHHAITHLVGLVVDTPLDCQLLSDALQDDWDDEEHREEVFGPHFTEAHLSDTLDLVQAVEAMNKGYIL